MDKQDRSRPSQVIFLLFFATLIPLSAAAVAPAAFPTEPNEGNPRDIALKYIEKNWESLGLTRADITGMVLRDEYQTRHNGLIHLYFQQELDGLEVVNAILGVSVDRQGRLASLSSRFVPNLEGAVGLRQPLLTAEESLERAARYLELPPREGPLRKLLSSSGRSRETVFGGGRMSKDDVPVKLCYFPVARGDVRLAWGLVVRLHNNLHWYNLFIDARSGELLKAHDWVGRFAVASLGLDTAEYRVFPLPLMNPDEGQRSLVRAPADPLASPFGWHDTNGIPGPEHTDTQGNNVSISVGASGIRPMGGSTLQFDFPLDLSQPPAEYAKAAMVNLFYWVNVLHDLHYQYGFDEGAGNFQVNNYDRGGVGGDSIQAASLVVEMVTFATPPDGTSPQMRMFVATPTTALIPVQNTVTLRLASGTTRDFPAVGASFGTILKTEGVTGFAEQALYASLDDSAHPGGPPPLRKAGSQRTDACSTPTNELRGKIAIVDDGGCSVVVKVTNVQEAGAIAMILVGQADEKRSTLGGHSWGGGVAIPVVAVTASQGKELRADSSARVTLRSDNSLLERASELDAGVVIHEYGHGVVSRLTGGPSSAGCVQAAQSMGITEGTGDFWALAFTAKHTDTGERPRAISNYVFFQSSKGKGVRGVPYTVKPHISSMTAEDLVGLKGIMIPHGSGTVWASALWEAYWNMVKHHGFDTDLYRGKGGNNLMLQLVMDGLKLQPCSPTFIEARDAILQADRINYQGKNQCRLWRGFAKWGFGVDAVDTGNPDKLNVLAGYKVPAQCGASPKKPARTPGRPTGHAGHDLMP